MSSEWSIFIWQYADWLLTAHSSTCSVTVEENEQVVNYVLSKRPNVKLVSTDLPFGKEGFTSYGGKHFDSSLSLTRRYYPHTYNVVSVLEIRIVLLKSSH